MTVMDTYFAKALVRVGLRIDGDTVVMRRCVMDCFAALTMTRTSVLDCFASLAMTADNG